ncbi:MAG: hypothetical protein QM730_14840 [Anaerolineales bacterium]
MRKWLVSILLLGLLMFPARAGAQNEIKIDTLKVELWSEYDQPSMLVISEFVLSKDTPVPAVVTIRFPKQANLMAVAINQNGDLFNANFDGPTEQGNWDTIKITVESYDPYRVEYYQQLTREGTKRTFEYQWTSDYAVKALSVGVLVPTDSTSLITSPILSSTSVDGGFITGSVTKSGLKAGEAYNFKVEYSRESNAVVNAGDSSSVVQPSEPIGPTTEGRVSIDKIPYLVGGIGVILIVIALFFYWRSTQSESALAPRRRKRQSTEPPAEGQAYCHECGARAHEGDRFCRTCGSRLRTSS